MIVRPPRTKARKQSSDHQAVRLVLITFAITLLEDLGQDGRLADGNPTNLHVLPVMRTSTLTVILLLLVISATLGLAPLLAPSTILFALPIPLPLEAVLTDALLSVLAQLLRVSASGCGIDTLVRVVLLGNLACGTDAHLPLVGLGDQITLALDHALASLPVLFVSLDTFTLVGVRVQFLGVSALGNIDTLSVLILHLRCVADTLLSLGVRFVAILADDDTLVTLTGPEALGAFAVKSLLVENPVVGANGNTRAPLLLRLFGTVATVLVLVQNEGCLAIGSADVVFVLDVLVLPAFTVSCIVSLLVIGTFRFTVTLDELFLVVLAFTLSVLEHLIFSRANNLAVSVHELLVHVFADTLVMCGFVLLVGSRTLVFAVLSH